MFSTKLIGALAILAATVPVAAAQVPATPDL